MKKKDILNEILIDKNLNYKEKRNTVKYKMFKNTNNILSYFTDNSISFYKKTKLRKIYNDCLDNKYIYSNTSYGTFEKFLKELNIFTEKITLKFPLKSYTIAYKNKPNIFEIALSINSKAYLSHYTAGYLHNLTNNIPKSIFINIEKPKPLNLPKKEILEQKNIDKAFYMPSRETKNITTYNGFTLNILNGKYSNNLGIIAKNFEGKKITLTNIERTLIDITVSPYYSGGCYEVLNVYKKAKGKFKTENLIKILKQLDYIYPYHQCIGFFMEKAGFKEHELQLLESLGINYKFFIQRELKENDRNFSERWNLFFPKFL